MALILILLLVWIASSLGQVILGRLAILRDRPLERFVYSGALGLGIGSYGVFALGLCGLLSRTPVMLWWGGLAILGLSGMKTQWQDLRGWLLRGKDRSLPEEAEEATPRYSLLEWASIVGLIAVAVIAAVSCFRPPGAFEWDVLAYHLADPKVYTLQHRITVLPTEHHSNFPFTMELLFAVGLLFDGYALANLFHLAMTVLTCLALISFCARMLNRSVGLFASLLYATTPLVLWEAGVAYIDNAAALYATLSIFGIFTLLHDPEMQSSSSLEMQSSSSLEMQSSSSLEMQSSSSLEMQSSSSLEMQSSSSLEMQSSSSLEMQSSSSLEMQSSSSLEMQSSSSLEMQSSSSLEMQSSSSLEMQSPSSFGLKQRSDEGHEDHALRGRAQWSWIVLSGLMMGFALGTKYLALIPAALVVGMMILHRQRFRMTVLYLSIAVVVGSPWYIKNLVWMHNPVYPFYYRLFPASRYWSQDREDSYRSEQAGFGFPHSLSRPQETFLNLIESPWREFVNFERYYNAGEVTFSAMIGGLYAGLGIPLLLIRRLPRVVRDAGLLTLIQLGIWFFLAQIGRYLLQFLPLAALLSGYCLWILIEGMGPAGTHLSRAWRLLAGILLLGQPLLVIAALLILPTGGKEAAEFKERTGLYSTALSIPDAFAALTNPGSRGEQLNRSLDVYNADRWINTNTSPKEGVVLYEETRGFYLDRPYLWGNGKHASYIPYGSFLNGAELTAWFIERHFTHAIINLNWSPQNRLRTSMEPSQAELMLNEWYVDRTYPRGEWEGLVGDAIKRGLWSVVTVEHGNVILQIGTKNEQGANSAPNGRSN